MSVSELVKGLSNEDVLAKRASARNLADLAESSPDSFSQGDIESIIKSLREEDDAMTVECILAVVEYLTPLNRLYFVNAGLLRVLTDVFVKNMEGVGTYVGRSAIRLIPAFASADLEAAKNLGVVSLMVRSLMNASDAQIRWYASMGLRTLDTSLVQAGAQEIVAFSIAAMEKEREEIVRVVGALTLSLVVMVAPQALKDNEAVGVLIQALTNDPSEKVQNCAALALQFVARKDPSLFKDTKIVEGLCRSLTNNLEAVKKKGEERKRETLVTVASTMSILALKDPDLLIDSKAIEKIDIAEVISSVLEQSEVEPGLRSILVSGLVDMSEKGSSQQLNSKRMVEVLIKLLEHAEEEDDVRRSAISVLRSSAAKYPNLFNEVSVLQRVAAVSQRKVSVAPGKERQKQITPLDILNTLAESDRGLQVLSKGYAKLCEEDQSAVKELILARDWQSIIDCLKQKGIIAEIAEKKAVTAVSRTEPVVAEKKPEAKPRRLTEDQRNMLQEIIETYAEISMPQLAQKLRIDESIIRDVLIKLIKSGRLPFKIQDDVLYLKREPPSRPAAQTAAGRCLICNEALGEGAKIAKCPFCGTPFHVDHYRQWTEAGRSCPKCGVNWAGF